MKLDIKKRLRCRGCTDCLGLMKTETSVRILYECKVPEQSREVIKNDK